MLWPWWPPVSFSLVLGGLPLLYVVGLAALLGLWAVAERSWAAAG